MNMANYTVSYYWSIATRPDEFSQYAKHQVRGVPDVLSGKLLQEYIQSRIIVNGSRLAEMRYLSIIHS
jgi:hypothetical protein